MRSNRFTLVELIVAMAILVAVSAIVALASHTFYSTYARAERVTARLKENIAIDNLMDVHIRNLIPFQWQDENGNSRFVFDGRRHTLLFTTLRRTYGSRPGALLFIRLFVEEEKLIAEYASTPRLPWKTEEAEKMPFEREVIAEKIRQITFEYAEKAADDADDNGSGIEWFDYWAEEEHASPPLALRITVERLDGTAESWLRRVAGVSKNTTFGSRSTWDGSSARFTNALENGATGGSEE